MPCIYAVPNYMEVYEGGKIDFLPTNIDFSILMSSLVLQEMEQLELPRGNSRVDTMDWSGIPRFRGIGGSGSVTSDEH